MKNLCLILAVFSFLVLCKGNTVNLFVSESATGTCVSKFSPCRSVSQAIAELEFRPLVTEVDLHIFPGTYKGSDNVGLTLPRYNFTIEIFDDESSNQVVFDGEGVESIFYASSSVTFRGLNFSRAETALTQIHSVGVLANLTIENTVFNNMTNAVYNAHIGNLNVTNSLVIGSPVNNQTFFLGNSTFSNTTFHGSQLSVFNNSAQFHSMEISNCTFLESSITTQGNQSCFGVINNSTFITSGNSSIFAILNFNSSRLSSWNINNTMISSGSNATFGIYTTGNLTITNSVILGNLTHGIQQVSNSSAFLIVSRTALSSNSTGNYSNSTGSGISGTGNMSISNVSISGNFIHGIFQNSTSNSTYLVVSNSTISSNSTETYSNSTGSGISGTGNMSISNVSISGNFTHGIFQNSIFNSSLEIFHSNISSVVYGVYARNSSVDISNSAFSGSYNASILAESIGNFTLKYSTVDPSTGPMNVTILGNGTISDVTFHNRTGASIQVTGGTWNFTSVQYSGNGTCNSNGSAIQVNSAVVSISNSTFHNASSTAFGGVIYLQNSTFTISNSTFSNNTAVAGGSLFLQDSRGFLNNSRFTNNTAKIGGAVFVKNSSLSVMNVNFTKNVATFTGGAMEIANVEEQAQVNLGDTTFTENLANSGSAISCRQLQQGGDAQSIHYQGEMTFEDNKNRIVEQREAFVKCQVVHE